MDKRSVEVPDIGDFQEVEVIEILVKTGDHIQEKDSLITLESDKASMDVPSPRAGTISKIHLNVGDKVSEGRLILDLAEVISDSKEIGGNNLDGNSESTVSPDKRMSPSGITGDSQKVTTNREPLQFNKADLNCEVLVLGAGPGGYTAAFRAADLGKKVILVERYETLGGVCLNVGCIPSKALLHAAKVIDDAQAMKTHGIEFGTPSINPSKLTKWKDSVIGKLTTGLSSLAKQRKVNVVIGKGHFLDSNHLQVDSEKGKEIIRFEHAIIAAGSVPVKLPFLPEDLGVMDSTGALELQEIPETMLVIGGGIIGLEMATVYRAMGTRITVVEMFDGLMIGADRDLVKPFHRHVSRQYEHIWLETRVTKVEAQKKGFKVFFEGKNAPENPVMFERILSAVGRTPNGLKIGAENAGVSVDEKGFIPVDSQMRTNVSNIFAIGDIVGQPMLAHKATHEGKVAAEVICGLKSHFDARTIPSVAYTDPELAWAGITEEEAKSKGISYGKGTFPWAASGRSLALERDEGLTKILFEEETKKIIGIGIVGPNAGDLIGEGVLAIEMGADATDIGASIHPHPTLSETIGLAAEAYEGTITDLYLPKRK